MGTTRTLGALSILAGSLWGQDRAPSMEDLQALLDTPVVTAAKKAQRASQAPAVISVIRAEEIRALGLRSVAEALALVPGFYAVDDFLAPNVGVRGISGGMRAYGRILKVMIDGQPVAFRPDGANFMGPELIPMEAIERIEVVRGPASALYGANAFLGVVNIITREAAPGWEANLQGTRHRQGSAWGSGWEAAGLWAGRDLKVLLAASSSRLDRSGHTLPAISPIQRLKPPKDQTSRDDLARPRSGLLRVDWKPMPRLDLGLLAHWSGLDSKAEWLDFGTLSHANRVALANRFARIKAGWKPEGPWSLEAFAAFSKGAPTGDERLNAGSTTTYPRRDFATRGLDAGAEFRWWALQGHEVTLGYDFTRDDHKLMEVYTITAATGRQVLASLPQGNKVFTNRGLYLQYALELPGDAEFTGNVRREDHSAYGSGIYYRLGAVRNFGRGFHAKLLYGTSFKAPSAWQLYAQPLYAGETLGNPNLRPETAETFEVETGWRASNHLHAALSLFRTRVKDKVELAPYLSGQRPTNLARQDSEGLEGEVRWFQGRQKLTGGFAFQRTEDRVPDPLGEKRAPSSLYPSWTALLRWETRPWRNGVLDLLIRHASERRASASNITQNYYTPYTLPATTKVDLSYSHLWRSLELGLRVQNLLDKAYAEPGFRGYDVPGRKREAQASLRWTFGRREP